MNAIVTGASKGIGKAIAIKLAQNGYNLAICARNETTLKQVADQLLAMGVKVIAIPTGCSKKDEVISFINQVKSEMQKIDVLVNNVGVFLPGNVLDEEDEVFEEQQLLNVNATYYFSKNIGNMMREVRSGHIFNICSVASKQVIEGAGSYCVTKTAMLSLNHVFRKALAEYNVKVTAILPGSTITDSWEGTTIPNETFVQPEDIANSLYTILNLSKGTNVDELVLTPLKFNTK